MELYAILGGATSWRFQTRLLTQRGEELVESVSAEGPHMIMMRTGAISNLFGRIEEERRGEEPGRRIISATPEETHFPIAKYSVGTAIDALSRMDNSNENG